MKFLKRVWSAAPIAAVILGLAVAAGIFFAVRMAVVWIYWNDPSRTENGIQAWMTPRYISHSWQVPRDVVADVLEQFIGEAPERGPANLRQIAQANDMSVEDLIAKLEAAIAIHRASIEQESN